MEANAVLSKTIWTIGHSTRTIETFLEMLSSFNIQLLADVRRFPGSRKYPHFNKDSLNTTLLKAGIKYVHFEALGGRRNVLSNSVSTGWHNKSFQGYADYMQTNEFKNAINLLKLEALKQRTVYMCSEAVWWRCHRSLISDYLKNKGWQVIHIMNINKSTEHPYTSVAKIIQGNLFYGIK